MARRSVERTTPGVFETLGGLLLATYAFADTFITALVIASLAGFCDTIG
ncbi:hypothetical protein HDC95_003243 [Microbacterium sp. AK031]|nr:hypothetical protein [Microbacterium sp. AK031]